MGAFNKHHVICLAKEPINGSEERDMTDDEIWAAKASGYWLKGMSWIATLGGVIPGAGFVLGKAF
jgi:hypothetical protein